MNNVLPKIVQYARSWTQDCAWNVHNLRIILFYRGTLVCHLALRVSLNSTINATNVPIIAKNVSFTINVQHASKIKLLSMEHALITYRNSDNWLHVRKVLHNLITLPADCRSAQGPVSNVHKVNVKCAEPTSAIALSALMDGWLMKRADARKRALSTTLLTQEDNVLSVTLNAVNAAWPETYALSVRKMFIRCLSWTQQKMYAPINVSKEQFREPMIQTIAILARLVVILVRNRRPLVIVATSTVKLWRISSFTNQNV
jgi:hypothetical protein